MKWWRDTLARRLFLLMWVALVASQLLAWVVFTQLYGGSFGGPMPVFPSLPVPGLSRGPMMGVPPGPGGPPDGVPGTAPGAWPPGRPGSGPFVAMPGPGPGFAGGPPDFAGGPPPRPGPPMALRGRPPALLLAIDYALRMLVVAFAAWWGSRWLAAPMRSLVRAGEQLAARLGRGEQKAPRLYENEGTLEVREAARVFNGMASEIEQLFDERTLMLAALSHDLRTPLTRLRLRLEAAEIPDTLRAKATADLTAMNGLIEEVLGLFRGADDESLREVDVAALVQALVDDCVEQGEQVRCTVPETLTAKARSAALRRVVENLVGNALRYGRDVEVEVRAEPDAVVLSVADRGPGLAPELLDRVFQPFFRADASRSRSSGGTGLGLFIARDLCRRMGARLTLANRDGGGLTAEVRLIR